jgi:hypothetical protein
MENASAEPPNRVHDETLAAADDALQNAERICILLLEVYASFATVIVSSEGRMGELAAWLLGAGLGFTAKRASGGAWRTMSFALAIVLLGALVTLLSGEMFDEPWLVIVDIGQVAIAAACGAFVLYPVARRLRVFLSVSPET